MSDVIVIGVAGGTGSGKTTLVKALVNRFGDNITVLSSTTAIPTPLTRI